MSDLATLDRFGDGDGVTLETVDNATCDNVDVRMLEVVDDGEVCREPELERDVDVDADDGGSTRVGFGPLNVEAG